MAKLATPVCPNPCQRDHEAQSGSSGSSQAASSAAAWPEGAQPGGGSGGHHGLDSVTQHLGSNEYARLRIGIGRKHEAREITNHVLGRFEPGEQELLEKVLSRAADQVECWLSDGLQKAMSQFNGAVSPTNEENKK